VDLAKLLKLLVIHDLGEAVRGDVPAPLQVGDKAAEERADFASLTAALPEAVAARLLALWDEYDRAETVEARIAKGLDKLETCLQHVEGANPEGFDYAWNLGYGREWDGAHPTLDALRALVDAETARRAAAEPGAARQGARMDYDYDLGVHGRPVSTGSAAAQRWFDRGLVWCYGYNHEEAVACFERALAEDPGCAMAHWGVAYASGPNYNMPWELFDEAGRAATLSKAHDATAAALGCAGSATAAERALIEALPARYPQREPSGDMGAWNDAFADAMRAAHRAHPEDAEIRTIFAEAIMNRTPWRMWDLATGGVAAGAGTAEARAVLEEGLAAPGGMEHPGLLHLYVHLMEMSPTPEVALPAADRLRELVPDAGHLVHMPTHIDVLCGHYRDATHWNLKAIEADRKYLARVGALNIYSGYRVHDYHFAVYGAMFLGQYRVALAAAEELIATTPEELLRIASPPMADYFESYLAVKQHVLVRFGRWREILAQDLPEDVALYCNTVAMMRYARGVALAALGRVGRPRRRRRCSGRRGRGCRGAGFCTTTPARTCSASPRRCSTARSRTAGGSTTRPSRICGRRWRRRTGCPTTSPGAGCSRCGTRSGRCCWSRGGWRRPRRSIARISGSAGG
jgi:tetratricopeptide (TPR) repeat protein